MTDERRDAEIEDLRRRLQEAEDTLRAIRRGEVDALVIDGPDGDRVYTLQGAEHPYRIFVEQMQEAAVSLTPQGDVAYCNRRFAELVGLPLEKIVGGPITRFLFAHARDALAAVLQAGGGRSTLEVVGATGTSIPVYVSVNAVLWEGSETFCLVMTDLTELYDARSGRAEAEAASRAKDQFLAMLGHELRNPLGAIATATSILERLATPGDAARRAREVIVRQAGHLTRLVDDLLDITRLTTGKIALTRAPLDLAEEVRRTVEMLRSSGMLGRHALRLDTQPVWVYADAARVEQIVTNLVNNAVKYTPDAGAVAVSVRREGAEAVLRVVDTGVGIPAELLPRVFDLFVQGEASLDRSAGGLGIGLTLVHRLAMLHGGTAEAASEGRGRGSVFSLRLPAIASPALTPAEPPAAPAGSAPRRVLIVEDNEDSREMLRAWLALAGHEVHVAADGLTGVEDAARLQPDIVLLDVGLPGIDGYEAARRIRAGTGGHRVLLVAITGYGQEDHRRRAHEAGFDSHLVKPFDPLSLTSLLARGLLA